MPSPEPSLDPGPRVPAGQLYRLAWIFYLILALVAVVWLGLEKPERTICAEGGVCLALFVDPAGWPLDLGLGFAAALLILGTWELVCRLSPLARSLEHRLAGLVGSITPDEAVAVALVSGFAEELFFRGAVQGSLGWPLATLLFAIMHTGPGRALKLWGIYAGVVGLVFAGLAEWRGNLLAPIVAHFLINGFGLWRLARAQADPELSPLDPSAPAPESAEESAAEPDPGAQRSTSSPLDLC